MPSVSRLLDLMGPAGLIVQALVASLAAVVGFSPLSCCDANRFQLLKVGYQWLGDQTVPGTRDDIQYVTSIDSLRKSSR
ncbi:MAG TPA: hypothetical protein VFS12_06020 [Terriglobia bacterium]|nr:hypothetical protein [Terriglobia bacterium]